MRVDFAISRWAAWAPGLTTPEAWETWAKGATPAPPRGAEAPPLTEVPAMSRRRIEKLGRLGYQVAQWVQRDDRGKPLVFASRHGEANRSHELLGALARDGAVPPTSFALSVHNAAGSQYSITRGETASVSAVSNGRFTVEAGLLEALALLGDGHDEVVLVTSDAALCPLYAPFDDEPQADFAWAWALRRGDAFSLSRAPVGRQARALPHALEVLRFFLSRDAALEQGDGEAGWRWARRA